MTTLLSLHQDLTVRPFAGGSVALLGDGPPVLIGATEERIVAVCARPTDREELVELLGSTYDLDPGAVGAAIDQLLDAGLLRASPTA